MAKKLEYARSTLMSTADELMQVLEWQPGAGWVLWLLCRRCLLLCSTAAQVRCSAEAQARL